MSEKSALIIEGGAIRSIFSAGLLDGFKQYKFNPFDFYIGVSGGAYNLLNYINQQSLSSHLIYKRLINDAKFINTKRYLKGGHLIDIDYLNQNIFNHHGFSFHVDDNDFRKLHIVTTSVDSGLANYIQSSKKNINALLKATAALPLLYREFPKVEGIKMTDGGIADGIPVKQAIRMGATRILVVRSRHHAYKKTDTLMHRYIRWRLRRFPCLVNTMKERLDIYHNTIALINQPPEGIEIIEVCPPTDFKMPRFSCKPDLLEQGYQLGKVYSGHVIKQWC